MLIIKIHIYGVFIICSKHGIACPGNLKYNLYSWFKYEHDKKGSVRLSIRKVLTLKDLLIGKFMVEYYFIVLKA